jgi:hypothetical protein
MLMLRNAGDRNKSWDTLSPHLPPVASNRATFAFSVVSVVLRGECGPKLPVARVPGSLATLPRNQASTNRENLPLDESRRFDSVFVHEGC